MSTLPVIRVKQNQQSTDLIDKRSASCHVQSDILLSFDRLCKPHASDIILDPMCGTGAIPLEVRHHVHQGNLDSLQNVLSSERTYNFSVASSPHGCLLTGTLNAECWEPSDMFSLKGGKKEEFVTPPTIACCLFVLKRGPLNLTVPSTLLVTTMTWLSTARSITSFTFRSGGQIKAGGNGDVWIHL